MTQSKQLYKGVCFTYQVEQLQREKEFLDLYKRRYGEDARLYADSSYDGVFLLVKAIQESKSKGIALKEAMKQVAYKGVVGNYRYSDDKSLSLGKASLVCIKKQQVVVQ